MTDPHRLPRTVLPRHYDLRLVPDLDAATFAGTVEVDADVVAPTDEVVLNAVELDLDRAAVELDGTTYEADVRLDEDTERASLTLPTLEGPLPLGPIRVLLTFRGILNDKLRGFYRSTFTDDDGTERVIATTQMEATDARRALPCWDEPDLKATFTVTLDVPSDLFAVSNAAEVERTPIGDGRDRVRFAETMPMSTYLLAFVVGPLEATEPVDVDGVPLRVVHRAGQGHLTAFALESGAFALRHFAEYFGVPYPADKLDLVAVPDFAFGAMENLGCVTFRDALLIVDPERSTRAELQRVADVIHHEIAHMWFGDLVTMAWWEGIWLNEAFATFMEMLCTDAFRPEWDRWTDFGIARGQAFDTDALSSTRPIEFEVISPADAEGMFDILTYEKGAAVVRMLEQYLGPERFRDGIRLYISRHAHGNTATTDLWDAIEEATDEPVRRIMDSWILQGGHPEIAVEVTPTVDGAEITLAQRRFRYLGADLDAGADAALWSVPVLVRWAPPTEPGGGAGTEPRTERVLLEGDRTTLELDAPPVWVLANSGGSGFFRVHHVGDGLAAAASAPDLTALERYGLLDDSWAALLAGTVEVDRVVDLLRRHGDETDLSVWQRVLGILGSLDRLVDDADRPALQAWVRGLVGPALRRTGLDPVAGEDARTGALRAALWAALGTIGVDDEVVERSRALLVDDTSSADLLDAATRVVAAAGGKGVAADLRRRAAGATTPQDRLRYLGAMADQPGDAEIDDFLALCLTDEVRSQDAPFLLRRVLTHRAQGARAWDVIERRWDEIDERFPSNSISRMLEGIRSIVDRDLADRVDAFLDSHPVPQGERPIAQHRERMRAGVLLRARVGDAIAPALDGR